MLLHLDFITQFLVEYFKSPSIALKVILYGGCVIFHRCTPKVLIHSISKGNSFFFWFQATKNNTVVTSLCVLVQDISTFTSMGCISNNL